MNPRLAGYRSRQRSARMHCENGDKQAGGLMAIGRLAGRLNRCLPALALLLHCNPGLAVGQAGGSIENVATASYVAVDTMQGRGAVSNTAFARIAAQAGIELQDPREQVLSPGDEVVFAHSLWNRGNATDRYSLSLAFESEGSAFELEGLRFIRDLNANGRAEAGEPEIDGSVSLPSGQVLPFVVVGRVPTAALPGQQSLLRLTATSDSDTRISASVLDRVVLAEQVLPLRLGKQSIPACDVPLDPGDSIRYVIDLSNPGGPAPAAKSILLDGTSAHGVLIADVIPANTSLIAEMPEFAPVQARAMVQLMGMGAGQWLSFSRWDRSGQVARIGLLVPVGQLGPGGQARLAFSVRINPLITPDTVIRNVAEVDLDGDGLSDLPQVPVCNQLNAMNPGDPFNRAQIRFLEPVPAVRQACTAAGGTCSGPRHDADSDFQDVQLYRLDSDPGYNLSRDGVYIEVFSTSLNGSSISSDATRRNPDDPNSQVIITARVQSARTGDFMEVVLIETAPNTGRFRSIRPIRLAVSDRANGRICPANGDTHPVYSGAAAQGCALNAQQNDTLTVSIRDADGQQTELVDVAIVDPLGVVFDTVTLAPINGATVYLCEGSPLNNPGVDQVRACVLSPDPDRPGQFLQPIVTGSDPTRPGFFQYPRIFPGDYYLTVVPPPGYGFPSNIRPADFQGRGFVVNEFSYGRDGFAGVASSGVFTMRPGDPILVVDIPMDPDPRSSDQLILSKTVNRPEATIGDVLEYSVLLVNNRGADAGSVMVTDVLPFGFKYVAGSARYGQPGDLQPRGDPAGAPGQRLEFGLGVLEDGQRRELKYRVTLTAGARDGDGINRAQASAFFAGRQESTPEDSATVRVRQEPLFSDRSHLSGKLYIDADCDRRQTPHEWPLPGVRLYLQDGTWVVTDEDGMYSLYGLQAGNHVIKVDETTLPAGVRLKPLDNRHAADGDSRFVDLRPGEWHRADFASQCNCADWDALKVELERRQKDLESSWLYEWAERNPAIINLEPEVRDLARRNELGADGDLSSGEVFGPQIQAGARTGEPPENQGARARRPGALRPVELLLQEYQGKQAIPDPEAMLDDLTAEQIRTWIWPRPTDEVTADGRFIVVIPAGVTPILWINGKVVDNDAHLGFRGENRKAGAQIVAWYGLPLHPGLNRARVLATDQFGVKRNLMQRTFQVAGAAAQLRLQPRSWVLQADGGKSSLAIDLSLTDRNGLPVNGSRFVSLQAGDGYWLNADQQSNAHGTQIEVVNGRAVLFLASGSRPGKVRVTAKEQDGNLEHAIEVELISPMRPLIAVGILELSARAGSLHDSGILPSSADEFEQEWNLDGRAAMFLKGKIRGDLLLTLAYDSAKGDDAELFRDIDPNSYYPIYGDASIKGYDAQSRDKLFVKIERGRSSVAWGDFLTDVDQKRHLGMTHRALTGANARFENQHVAVRAFAAPNQSARRIEEIRGNGTATDYRLLGVPVLRNSEVIELTIRDRDNTGIIMSSERLDRFGDYNLDDRTGELTFSRVVSSQDAQGNPIIIRVTYDSLELPNENLVAGARVELKLNDEMAIGTSYTVDDAPGEGETLSGTYFRYRDGKRHELEADVARMTHEDAEPSGNAYRLHLRSKWGSRLDTEVTWGRAEEGFSSRESSVQQQREEIKVAAQYRAGGRALKLESLSSTALNSEEVRRVSEASIQQQLAGWTLLYGLRHTAQQGLNTGAGEGDNDRFTSTRLRADRSLALFGRDLVLHLDYVQDIEQYNRRELQFGLDWQVHQKARMYARHEVINSLSGLSSLSTTVERSNTIFGVEQDFLPFVRSYSEYRQRGVQDGRELETAHGLRGAFESRPGVQWAPSFEFIETTRGPRQGKDIAISLGYSHRAERNFRTQLRGDARWGHTSDYFGFMGSYIARLNLDWSSILRERLSWEVPHTSGDPRVQSELSLGLARRPREDNAWHMLGLLRWKLERNAGSRQRSAYLLSSHQNWQIDRDFILSGRLGLKWQEERFDDLRLRSEVQLLGGRLIWDLDRRWDLDLHAAALSTQWFDDLRYSLGLGLHYIPMRNMRIGVGYNFVGFRERDLDEEEFYAPGWLFGIEYKFDEDMFQWLRPDGGALPAVDAQESIRG